MPEPTPGSPADLQPEADPIEVARKIALDALSTRARSQYELVALLASRRVAPEIARTVLDRLEDVGLINDREFAKAWTASRRRTKGLSHRALALELAAKGIDRTLAKEVLDEFSPEDEYLTALAIAEKKARTLVTLSREVQLRRIAGLLARKGFSSSVASRVLRDVIS